MSTPPIPDKWFALSQLGKVVKEGSTKESVLSEDAFYYLRRMYYMYNKQINLPLFNYFVFDIAVNPTRLKFNGIKCSNSSFNEGANKDSDNKKRINFNLVDKAGNTVVKYCSGGLEAFHECILFMEELGKFGSEREMELFHLVNAQYEEIESSRKTIADLEKINGELQAKLNSIHESKTDLRKLSQLLYEN